MSRNVDDGLLCTLGPHLYFPATKPNGTLIRKENLVPIDELVFLSPYNSQCFMGGSNIWSFDGSFLRIGHLFDASPHLNTTHQRLVKPSDYSA